MRQAVLELWHHIDRIVKDTPASDVCDQLIDLMISPLEIYGWEQYITLDPHRYTRNLIHPPLLSSAPSNKELPALPFQLVLMCWGPGQSSAVHDHAGSECCMRVMAGSIEEELFDILPCVGDVSDANGNTKYSVKSLKKTVLKEDMWTSVKGTIGWHRVGNASAEDDMAASLHLYYPPIGQYNIICPVDNTKKAVRACHFHSVNGHANK